MPGDDKRRSQSRLGTKKLESVVRTFQLFFPFIEGGMLSVQLKRQQRRIRPLSPKLSPWNRPVVVCNCRFSIVVVLIGRKRA